MIRVFCIRGSVYSVVLKYYVINVKKTAVYTNVDGDIVSYTSKTSKNQKSDCLPI